jgi:HEAT repeat protein
LLAQNPSQDFKRWACRQLLVVGSAASIPIVTPYLKEDGWMEACDILLALPGDQGVAALLQALPTLDTERRATLIHAVGLNHARSAVPALTAYANDPDNGVSTAALLALSKIHGTAAGEALLHLKPTAHNACRIIEARLNNATLQKAKAPRIAKALFESVYNDATAQPHYRAAALIGLTTLNPKALTTTLVETLKEKDVRLRHAAVTALYLLEPSACENLRSLFPSLPKETQLTILPLWANRKITSAEPEVLACLTVPDSDLNLTALVALRKMGTAKAIPPLLNVAAKGGPLAKEAESTLQQIPGEAAVKALKQASQDASPADSTLAVKVLAARMDAGSIPFLLDVATGTDIKKSEIALTAIKNHGGIDTLPWLRTLLHEKPELKDSLLSAVIAICKRQQRPKRHLSEFLDTPIKEEIEKQIKTLSMTNLANGKRLTASHPCQGNHTPECAIDNSLDTFWSCAFSPSWIQVDLEKPTPVSRIKVVNYVDGTRYYQHRVEISADAKQWTCVGDMSQNTVPATKEGVTHDFKEVTARYVRITMLKNSANPGMHISELAIYGVEQ